MAGAGSVFTALGWKAGLVYYGTYLLPGDLTKLLNDLRR